MLTKNIKQNHSLSPRLLPKLNLSPSSKFYRAAQSELTTPKASNQDSLILELERRLAQQRKELMNRDQAVKKVIYNFEAIVEAHNDEKHKNEEIRAKYLKKQQEIQELSKINSRLTELLQEEGLEQQLEEEKAHKKELKSLQDIIDKKNSELKDKSALILILENELDNAKKELLRVSNNYKKLKEEQEAKYTSVEIGNIIERNKELEVSLKTKEEQYIETQNQMIYLKENNNTLTAELKATKHNFNNLRKTYQKLKDADNESLVAGRADDNRLQISNSSEKLKFSHREKSEIDLNLKVQKSRVDTPDQLQELKKKHEKEERKLMKSLQDQEKLVEGYTRINYDLRENLRKAEESVILLTERNKYLEKDIVSAKEKANSYKKKYEEISVEAKLIQETLLYKDEKIKRDAERLKYLQNVEQELTKAKFLNKDLEDTCKHHQLKADRLTETVLKEKEKWKSKEASYFDTINNLVKEMNSIKNKDMESDPDSGNSLTFSKKLMEYENEMKNLKAELERSTKSEENYEKVLKKYNDCIGIIGVLLRQTEEILRCSNCYNSGKQLFLNYPCVHLLCKDCSESKCKECYSVIQQSLKPVFLETIPMILAQIRWFYTTQGWNDSSPI